MFRVEQVLVPVDFSSFSRCALAFAQTLGDHLEAPSEGATLQLAHAVESLPSYVRAVLFPYAPLGEDDRAFEAEIVDQAVAEIQSYFEIDEALSERFIGPPVVRFGSSKKWVDQWSRDYDVDLICMGAFGEHGTMTTGPGATSRRMAACACCPVALMRDYDPAADIGRIVVALDLGEDALRVLEVAMGLAIDLGATLELLHVIATPFIDDTHGMVEQGLKGDRDEWQDRTQLRAEGALETLIGELEYGSVIVDRFQSSFSNPVIRCGDPAREIADVVSARNCDMVVMGRGQRAGGLGRITSAVLAQVPRHAVVVPNPKASVLG